jgi:hypothetical protein
MELDRGRLGDIDRKILDSLDRDKRYRMVRVPVSEAVWSMWRRYCRALGVSMGRAIAGLIAHELGVVIDPDTAGGSVYVAEMQRRSVTRSPEGLDARERRLDEREGSLRASERRLRARTTPLGSSVRVKVGGNEQCPCGSGFKYKRCHGV